MRLLFVPVSLLLSSLLGCTATAPAELGDCEDGATVTWAEAGPVFAANCTRCHSTELVSSVDRKSAPVNWDYDNASVAMRDPSESWRRIYTENMPNDAVMSEEDKLVIWEWYSCDGPE